MRILVIVAAIFRIKGEDALKNPAKTFNEAASKACKYAVRLQHILAESEGLLQGFMSDSMIHRLLGDGSGGPATDRYESLVSAAQKGLATNGAGLAKQLEILTIALPTAGPCFAEALTPLIQLKCFVLRCMTTFLNNLGPFHIYVNSTPLNDRQCTGSLPSGLVLDPYPSYARLIISLLPQHLRDSKSMQEALEHLQMLPTSLSEAQIRVHLMMQRYVDAVQPIAAAERPLSMADYADGIDQLLLLGPLSRQSKRNARRSRRQNEGYGLT